MRIIVSKLVIAMLLLFMIGCQQSTYDSMKTYIDQIKVIDTHSHQGMPWKKKGGGGRLSSDEISVPFFS